MAVSVVVEKARIQRKESLCHDKTFTIMYHPSNILKRWFNK